MTNRVNVYMDDTYKEILETMVNRTGMNQSEIIREAIDNYFFYSEDYRKATERHRKRVDYEVKKALKGSKK